MAGLSRGRPHWQTSLGYDHVWTWDHIYAIFGDPYQPIFEGYTALAAVAQATERCQLGLFVGANPFRNPGLAVKSIVTIDHISGGRAIMGIGGAWFGDEHQAFGIDFGTGFGQRLDWLAEAVPAIRTLLDGGEVSSAEGGRYAFDKLRIAPLPLQDHVPIMIGGAGEKKNAADRRAARRHVERLRNAEDRCPQGRDPPCSLRRRRTGSGRDRADAGLQDHDPRDRGEAERVRLDKLAHNRTPLSRVDGDVSFWTGTPEQIAETMLSDPRVGFHTFIAELPAPMTTKRSRP